jgi:hypothetical protein
MRSSGRGSDYLTELANLFIDFPNCERLAFDLIKSDYIDQILASDEHSKLPEIQFGHEYFIKS